MNDLKVTITEKAAEKIKEVLEDTQDGFLCFNVLGGGCSGLQYGLAISEGELEIDDIEISDKDIRIVVDKHSVKYVNDCVIDYNDEGMMAGFKVENPNAAKSCGCGKSFSVSGEEYDTCGGCGYK